VIGSLQAWLPKLATYLGRYCVNTVTPVEPAQALNYGLACAKQPGKPPASQVCVSPGSRLPWTREQLLGGCG
jgi:hypothetical protein